MRLLTGEDGFVSVFDHMSWDIQLCCADKVWRDLLRRRRGHAEYQTWRRHKNQLDQRASHSYSEEEAAEFTSVAL